MKTTFVACFVLFFSINLSSHANEIQTGDNKILTNIHWQDANKKIHQLKDSDGQPRLLHFWAAWCFPCRAELPDMLEWKKKNSDLLIIPLSLDERIVQSKYFIKKYKLDMPALLLDEEDREMLDIPALPFTIFVSADGSYSGHFYGIAPWTDENFTTQIRQHFETK